MRVLNAIDLDVEGRLFISIDQLVESIEDDRTDVGVEVPRAVDLHIAMHGGLASNAVALELDVTAP
jgi:hypothetical protein